MSITPIQANTQPTSIASPVVHKAAAASSNTGSTSTDVSNLGGTFLQLLTQELQNQDPTAPMDSTQMVGQMISLNQLQQLASINQTLSKSAAAAVPAA